MANSLGGRKPREKEDTALYKALQEGGAPNRSWAKTGKGLSLSTEVRETVSPPAFCFCTLSFLPSQ